MTSNPLQRRRAEADTKHFFDCPRNLAIADSDHVSQVDCFAAKKWTNATEQYLVFTGLLNELVTLLTTTSRMAIEYDAIAAPPTCGQWPTLGQGSSLRG